MPTYPINNDLGSPQYVNSQGASSIKEIDAEGLIPGDAKNVKALFEKQGFAYVWMEVTT